MNTNTDYAALYYNEVSKDFDFLEKNVQDYPASSVARFILLYHLKKNNDPRFDEQAKQAGIYLNNPYWMEFQLSKLQPDGKLVESIEFEKNEPGESTELQEKFRETVIDNHEQNAGDEISQIDVQNENEMELPLVVETKEEELPEVVNEQISEISPLKTESSETANEEISNEPGGEIFNDSENEIIEQETKEEDLPTVVKEENNENLPSETEVPEETHEELVEKINDDANLNNEVVEVPLVEEVKEDISIEENLPERELEQQNEIISSTEEDQPNFNKDESVLNIKVPDENENSLAETAQHDKAIKEEDDDEAIPFEPLHTVDYFASQGIRLTEEALNNDQLGRQVKSFTAWLKSMKKLHPGQLPEQNEVIEKLIQTSSEVSNQNANVLTEAMAEVLVKQGKREKAIEMYQKLSLINPSKSAYFAAKIESLKTV